MENYDVFMLVILALTTLWGAYKGLAWQVASISALVVSYIAACRFRAEVAPLMPVGAPFNLLLAMLVIFLASNMAIWLIFHLVKSFIDRLKLREFDWQTGALFGLAKGILLCILITLFAMTFGSEQHRQTIVRSRAGYYISWLMSQSRPWIPREVREIVEPYVVDFQRKLDAARRADGERFGGERAVDRQSGQTWPGRPGGF